MSTSSNGRICRRMGAQIMKSLGQSTLSDAERATEALRLLDALEDKFEVMKFHEARFVQDMMNKRNRMYATPKQLFWLRDLYELYCV